MWNFKDGNVRCQIVEIAKVPSQYLLCYQAEYLQVSGN